MEQVLVVNRAALEARLGPGPFLSQNLETIRQFILDHHTFLPREQAEYDNTVRQIIPYVVLRRGRHYFLLRRLKKQTETRLHEKLSLGVGGHINPTEEAADDPIAAGLWRELSEEVTLSQITSLTCVGLINETTGGVSDYHTALVYLLETTGEVTVRETEKMSGSWASPQELSAVFDRLETWSQIVLEEVIFPSTV
ncbi:hypothetical protein [Evtepia gabavorous]|uniref:hypothetical protein n=1 Tax=Evtepia gabavorous TaxID=2211183 RepID=UPI003A8D1E78